MFDKILRRFRSIASGSDSNSNDQSSDAVFVLIFGKLPILVLSRNADGWTIVYTEEFKNQSKISPLVTFPDINKVYHSTELWPFFSVRIPSIARPEVKRTVQQEQLNYDDVAAMLKRFGRKSIGDPFELKPEGELVPNGF